MESIDLHTLQAHTWYNLRRGSDAMATKTVQVQLPDRLVEELERVVRDGWFVDEEEAIRQALREFLHSDRWHITEKFLLEDIEWAASLREKRE